MRAHARTQAEEGAVQTASGLVIQHVEEGKGRHPAPNSKVKGKITLSYLLSPFYIINDVILPRQARDKHRKT